MAGGGSKVAYHKDGLPEGFGQVADIGWVMLEVGNKITVTYPTTTTELYTYKFNSETLGSVLVTYTDTTKNDISEVERTA